MAQYPAILVKDLKRQFGEKKVLIDINLEITKGEIVVLKGVNGAGKTTLLRILTTLLRPSGGEAWLHGHSVVASPKEAQRQMGWIPATQNGFVPRLKGLQNIYFFGSLYGLAKGEIDKKLKTWDHFWPLKEALRTPFYLCSSGMKHALELFRGILHNPSILFLDEPGLHLDSDSINVIRSFIASERGQRTTLFSAHQSPLSDLASRQIEIVDGKIKI